MSRAPDVKERSSYPLTPSMWGRMTWLGRCTSLCNNASFPPLLGFYTDLHSLLGFKVWQLGRKNLKHKLKTQWVMWFRKTFRPSTTIVASWPFEAWGFVLVGPIAPKSSTWHFCILVTIDYFSKWTGTITLRDAEKVNITKLEFNLTSSIDLVFFTKSWWIMEANSLIAW